MPDVRVLPSCGGFYVTIDCAEFMARHQIDDTLRLSELIMESTHVATVPGSDFGVPRMIRLSYTSHRYDEAIDRLVAFIAGKLDLPLDGAARLFSAVPGPDMRHVIVVDPFSNGRQYAPAFHALGVRPVAVLSTPEPLPVYQPTWQPDDFVAIHRWSGDQAELADLVEELKALDPIAVVCGAECGVEFADLLTELVLPGTGNSPSTSALRRNKWQLSQALRNAGLPSLRQVLTDDPAEVDRWILDHGLEKEPLVVKPVNSVGADNVHLVLAGGDWLPAFESVRGGVNILGLPNSQGPGAGVRRRFRVHRRHLLRPWTPRRCRRLPVQQEPAGRPNWHLRHRRLPRARRARGRGVDRVHAPGAGRGGALQRLRTLRDHADRVRSPPAGSGGPPRRGGHQPVRRLATEDCHIDRSARHYVNGQFREGYELRQHVRAAFVSAPRAGRWVNRDEFDAVKKLETYHATEIPHRSGDQVAATVDIFTALGFVVLTATDHARIDADYLRLKELERAIVIDQTPALD